MISIEAAEKNAATAEAQSGCGASWFQPSLTGLLVFNSSTQDYILG
jgi:hypothetical protein